jgi:hypothetical protein
MKSNEKSPVEQLIFPIQIPFSFNASIKTKKSPIFGLLNPHLFQVAPVESYRNPPILSAA